MENRKKTYHKFILSLLSTSLLINTLLITKGEAGPKRRGQGKQAHSPTHKKNMKKRNNVPTGKNTKKMASSLSKEKLEAVEKENLITPIIKNGAHDASSIRLYLRSLNRSELLVLKESDFHLKVSPKGTRSQVKIPLDQTQHPSHHVLYVPSSPQNQNREHISKEFFEAVSKYFFSLAWLRGSQDRHDVLDLLRSLQNPKQFPSPNAQKRLMEQMMPSSLEKALRKIRNPIDDSFFETHKEAIAQLCVNILKNDLNPFTNKWFRQYAPEPIKQYAAKKRNHIQEKSMQIQENNTAPMKMAEREQQPPLIPLLVQPKIVQKMEVVETKQHVPPPPPLMKPNIVHKMDSVATPTPAIFLKQALPVAQSMLSSTLSRPSPTDSQGRADNAADIDTSLDDRIVLEDPLSEKMQSTRDDIKASLQQMEKSVSGMKRLIANLDIKFEIISSGFDKVEGYVSASFETVPHDWLYPYSFSENNNTIYFQAGKQKLPNYTSSSDNVIHALAQKIFRLFPKQFAEAKRESSTTLKALQEELANLWRKEHYSDPPQSPYLLLTGAAVRFFQEPKESQKKMPIAYSFLNQFFSNVNDFDKQIAKEDNLLQGDITFTFNRDAKEELGGHSEKYIMDGSDGNKYLLKVAPKQDAVAEVASNKFLKLVDRPHAEIREITLPLDAKQLNKQVKANAKVRDGVVYKSGTIQKMLKLERSLSGTFSFSELNPKNWEELYEQLIIDIIIGNSDNIRENYAIDQNQKVIGLDKGRALEDFASKLKFGHYGLSILPRVTDYAKRDIPILRSHIYDRLCHEYILGYIKLNLSAVQPLLDKITQLSNKEKEDFRNIISPYAELWGMSSNRDPEEFLDLVEQEKNGIRQKIEKFHEEMKQEREKRKEIIKEREKNKRVQVEMEKKEQYVSSTPQQVEPETVQKVDLPVAQSTPSPTDLSESTLSRPSSPDSQSRAENAADTDTSLDDIIVLKDPLSEVMQSTRNDIKASLWKMEERVPLIIDMIRKLNIKFEIISKFDTEVEGDASDGFIEEDRSLDAAPSPYLFSNKNETIYIRAEQYQDSTRTRSLDNIIQALALQILQMPMHMSLFVKAMSEVGISLRKLQDEIAINLWSPDQNKEATYSGFPTYPSLAEIVVRFFREPQKLQKKIPQAYSVLATFFSKLNDLHNPKPTPSSQEQGMEQSVDDTMSTESDTARKQWRQQLLERFFINNEKWADEFLSALSLFHPIMTEKNLSIKNLHRLILDAQSGKLVETLKTLFVDINKYDQKKVWDWAEKLHNLFKKYIDFWNVEGDIQGESILMQMAEVLSVKGTERAIKLYAQQGMLPFCSSVEESEVKLFRLTTGRYDLDKDNVQYLDNKVVKRIKDKQLQILDGERYEFDIIEIKKKDLENYDKKIEEIRKLITTWKAQLAILEEEREKKQLDKIQGQYILEWLEDRLQLEEVKKKWPRNGDNHVMYIARVFHNGVALGLTLASKFDNRAEILYSFAAPSNLSAGEGTYRGPVTHLSSHLLQQIFERHQDIKQVVSRISSPFNAKAVLSLGFRRNE